MEDFFKRVLCKQKKVMMKMQLHFKDGLPFLQFKKQANQFQEKSFFQIQLISNKKKLPKTQQTLTNLGHSIFQMKEHSGL